jgi:hypothetical protein
VTIAAKIVFSPSCTCCGTNSAARRRGGVMSESSSPGSCGFFGSADDVVSCDDG